MNKDALADSTRQRILNESRKLGISHELLTRRYVFERFLARLAHSALRDRLVLKGAMALVVECEAEAALSYRTSRSPNEGVTRRQ
jgi:hypothetical protein